MVGNRVFGHSLVICIAVALLLSPWGSIDKQVPEPAERLPSTVTSPKASMLSAAALPSVVAEDQELILGWQGNVAIGGLMVPYWMLVVSLLLGSVIAIMNSVGWTNLPSVVSFACFGLTAACSLVATIDFAYHGAIGAGCLLAIACALVGIAISPADEPVRVPKIHQANQERRQFRSAA
jgi:hypothetical protein